MLEGITIVDFTRLLPGPLATHILAQMGATVIKIESPKRMDYARQGLKPTDGVSTLFHQLNHNKDLRQIDYETAAGHAELMDLLEGADAIMEQFRPGAMAAWGLDYASLKARFPRLVYLSLTGYGQEGPMARTAGHDLNYLAQTGLLSLLRDAEGRPVVPGFQLADIGGAYAAVMALQGALLKQARTGQGSYLDVSLCDAVMPFLAIPYSLYSDGFDHRLFNLINGQRAVNYAVYICADGKWLAVGALELKFWNALCTALDKPDWQRKHQLELVRHVFPTEEVEALFKSRPRSEWLEQLKGLEVCVSPVLEIEELESHPHHQARGNFEEFKTGGGKAMRTLGKPFKHD
ncbi:MAG: CaiB/BaiF CoA-transferase family protein [Bacteroidota bacterium]